MLICLLSRWQKPWHRREPPASAGAACAAVHQTFLLV